jgi:hypothetical protein
MIAKVGFNFKGVTRAGLRPDGEPGDYVITADPRIPERKRFHRGEVVSSERRYGAAEYVLFREALPREFGKGFAIRNCWIVQMPY